MKIGIILETKEYEKAWNALYTICVINVESDSYYGKKRNVLGDKDTWLIGSMFANFEPYVSESNPGVFLRHTKYGMKVVIGHLQSYHDMPLYYNNQFIDFRSIDEDVNEWGYVLDGYKFDDGYTLWTQPYKPISEPIKQTFFYAHQALQGIVNYLQIKTPVISGNMVSKYFL